MTIPVTRNTARASSVPDRIRLAAMRTVAAGDSEERFAPRRWTTVAGHTVRRSPTIRAWRAPEVEAPRAPSRRDDAAPETIRPPFALGAGTGSRQSAAQRMRAVEQAFRDGLRRQAEAEAEG
jgi:hypothetical protein